MPEICLDVSRLEPCEPLERTLEALRQLPSGSWLRVFHRREPHLLYPMLEQLGFSWRLLPGKATTFELLIWRQGSPEPG